VVVETQQNLLYYVTKQLHFSALFEGHLQVVYS